MMSEEPDRRINRNGISFNSDYGMFCVGMVDGIRLYFTNPLQEVLCLTADEVGDVRYVDQLERTNIFAFVGSKYDDNTVCVYDAAAHKPILLLTASQQVYAVKIRRDRLIVMLRDLIHVFSFPPKTAGGDVERLATFEKGDNPWGIVGVCQALDNPVICFPGRKRGTVQVSNLAQLRPGDSSAPVVIQAHENEVACLALDSRGTFLGSASRKGTLIRVFETATRKKVAEFRRGSDTATVYSIAFSPDSSYLCATSDKGTVHVFAVRDQSLNVKSVMKGTGSLFSVLGSYTESLWSPVNFTVRRELPCLGAFVPGPSPTVVALCTNGSYHRYVFSIDGKGNPDGYDLFLEVGDDHDLRV